MTSRCYIVGPYRAATTEQIAANILNAWKAGIYVVNTFGYFPVIPHMNTAHMELFCKQPDSFWLENTLELMLKCQVVYVLKGWEKSEGSRAEVKAAKTYGLKIIYQD